MGAYDRFKTADVMGVRNYIKEGKHVLLIRRTEMGQSKNPKTKEQEKAVVEFKIMESDTQKVGQICSLVEMSAQQGYFGNVLAFTAGAMGVEIDEMKADEDFDAVFDAVWNVKQILTGTLVYCTAQQVKTKEGGDYTAKTFEPVDSVDYAKFGVIAPDGAWQDPKRVAEGEQAAA